MARGTTLVFKNHEQNGSFRSHQILKKKTPISSSFIVSCLDSFYFVLFCIVNHGGQLIHELSKISLFLAALKNGVDLYTRKYGKLLNDVEVLRQKWEKVHLHKLVHY